MREAMRRAVQLSTQAVERGALPFGAVVTRKDEIIASGHNLVGLTVDPTAHAEIVAIRRACEELGKPDLSDCELYTSCEPCPMCMGAVYWARIPRVWFAAEAKDAEAAGLEDAWIYRELQQERHERAVDMKQIRQEVEASKQVLQSWSAESGRQEEEAGERERTD